MYVKMDYKESLRRRGAIYCDWTFSSRHGPNAIWSREGVSRLLNDRGMLDYMDICKILVYLTKILIHNTFT